MTTNTAINSLPTPELSDSANIVTTVGPLTQALDTLLVPRFSSTAARDTAIVSPTSGQICWVTADLSYYTYNGSNWIPMVGVQKGIALVSFTSVTSATMDVNFPVLFAGVPTVMTNINSGAGNTNWWSRAISISSDDFTLYVHTIDGTSETWVNVPVGWIAFGF